MPPFLYLVKTALRVIFVKKNSQKEQLTNSYKQPQFSCNCL